jgi:molybdopterin synthase sulfur carrier subunit
MPVTVYLSERLRGRTNCAEVSAQGTTLGELLKELDRQYPGFKEDIYSPSKERIRDHVTVAINSHARYGAGLDLPLADGDCISFVAAAKGG